VTATHGDAVPRPPGLRILLAPRLLAARNALRRGRVKAAILVFVTALFWVGSFIFFERTLSYFQTITALGPILTQRLLVMLFVSFFAVLVISNVVTALTTFYLAADVRLLLAAPIPPRRIHQARFVETLVASSWMVLLFGLPAFLAYGVVYHAGILFYAGTVATLVPFLVIPAAIGVLVTTALVLVFPAQRARDVLVVATVALAAVGYLALRLLRPERGVATAPHLPQRAGIGGQACHRRTIRVRGGRRADKFPREELRKIRRAKTFIVGSAGKQAGGQPPGRADLGLPCRAKVRIALDAPRTIDFKRAHQRKLQLAADERHDRLDVTGPDSAVRVRVGVRG